MRRKRERKRRKIWCAFVGRCVSACVFVCYVFAHLCFCVCVKGRGRKREREREREWKMHKHTKRREKERVADCYIRPPHLPQGPPPHTHHTTHQPFRRASPPPTPLPSSSLPPPPLPSFSRLPPAPPASFRPLPLPLLLPQPPFECPHKSVTKSVLLLRCPPGERKRAFSVKQVSLHF